MRKVIQIALDSADNLLALCDDGTLWSQGSRGWQPLEPIPQDATAEPIDSAPAGPVMVAPLQFFSPKELYGVGTYLWTVSESMCREIISADDCLGCSLDAARTLVEATDEKDARRIAADPTALGISKNYLTVNDTRIMFLSDQIPF